MAHDGMPFRPGLMQGISVVLAPRETADAGAPIACLLAALGAGIHALDADLLDEEATIAAAQALPSATVLVCDGGALMRSAAVRDGADADAAGLRAAVEGAWTATRALVNARLAPAGFGKALLIAPRPADGADAAAAGAALENLARTTAVEWARLGVRVVALRPRDATPDAALAQCVAYLASPAGDYVSGCVLDLGLAAVSGVRS